MSPILLQRFEGAAIAVAALALYQAQGSNWLIFVTVFLAIDISAIGYAVNRRFGAITYNLGHTLVVPVLLGLLAWGTDSRILLLLAIIWLGHVGLDRAFGYGLKLPNGFQHTHLGRIGK